MSLFLAIQGDPTPVAVSSQNLHIPQLSQQNTSRMKLNDTAGACVPGGEAATRYTCWILVILRPDGVAIKRHLALLFLQIGSQENTHRRL